MENSLNENTNNTLIIENYRGLCSRPVERVKIQRVADIKQGISKVKSLTAKKIHTEDVWKIRRYNQYKYLEARRDWDEINKMHLTMQELDAFTKKDINTNLKYYNRLDESKQKEIDKIIQELYDLKLRNMEVISYSGRREVQLFPVIENNNLTGAYYEISRLNTMHAYTITDILKYLNLEGIKTKGIRRSPAQSKVAIDVSKKIVGYFFDVLIRLIIQKNYKFRFPFMEQAWISIEPTSEKEHNYRYQIEKRWKLESPTNIVPSTSYKLVYRFINRAKIMCTRQVLVNSLLHKQLKDNYVFNIIDYSQYKQEIVLTDILPYVNIKFPESNPKLIYKLLKGVLRKIYMLVLSNHDVDIKLSAHAHTKVGDLGVRFAVIKLLPTLQYLRRVRDNMKRKIRTHGLHVKTRTSKSNNVRFKDTATGRFVKLLD